MNATVPFSVDFAAGLAVALHDGQTEKDGAPYWHHLARVAEAVPLAYRATAWLHDLFEDTPWGCESLSRFGILPPGLCADLWALTKPARPGRRPAPRLYSEFIASVVESGSVPALVVKRADVADHLRPGHEAVLDNEQIEKCRDALAVLDATIEERRLDLAGDLIARTAFLAGRWNTAVVSVDGLARAARSAVNDPGYRAELVTDIARAGLAGAAVLQACADLDRGDRRA